jgi:hypothetical protein
MVVGRKSKSPPSDGSDNYVRRGFEFSDFSKGQTPVGLSKDWIRFFITEYAFQRTGSGFFIGFYDVNMDRFCS